MRDFLDLNKNAYLLLTIIIMVTIFGALTANTILDIEQTNIFLSQTMANTTNHLANTNLEPTMQPPLLYWLINGFTEFVSDKIQMLKLIPALTMAAIIFITFGFIEKQTNNKKYALISSVILATCPIFIISSKFITADLLYVLVYVASTFIFSANVYSNKYSNYATIIAGMLIGAGFCLEGFNGLIPLVINYLLINFIRGGFLINLKFNNPLFLIAGFSVFSSIWLTSLNKTLSFSQIIEKMVDFKIVENITNLNQIIESPAHLYIAIGMIPWIVMLPTCIICLLKTFKIRFNTSSFRTSLPLIATINCLFLGLYYVNIEQKFYILLILSFYLCIIIADRLTTITDTRISRINIIYALLILWLTATFANNFLHFTDYSLLTIKNELISSFEEILKLDNSIIILICVLITITVGSIIFYATMQSNNALAIAFISSIICTIVINTTAFNNSKIKHINYTQEQWIEQNIAPTDNVVFYKATDTAIALKANNSFYFDDKTKIKNLTSNDQISSTYIYYNQSQQAELNIKPKSCFNGYCLTKIKD